MSISRGKIIYFAVLFVIGLYLLSLGPVLKPHVQNIYVKKLKPVELAELFISGRKNYSVLDFSNSKEPLFLKNSLTLFEGESKKDWNSIYDFLGGNKDQLVILVGILDENQQQDMIEKLIYYGYRVGVLVGGVADWKSDILNPQPPREPTQETLSLYNYVLEISNFLKGKSLSATSAAPQTPPLKVEKAPKSSGGGGGGGC